MKPGEQKKLGEQAIQSTDWDGYWKKGDAAAAKKYDALREAHRKSAEINQTTILR